MRVVVQRVTRAEVRVAGAVVGKIAHGLLLFVGFTAGDDEERLAWMAAKIPALRIFRATDGDSSFERTLGDVQGGLLVVSQFTLYGDTRKGRRPSFIDAAAPADAERLYNRFVDLLCARTDGPVETGRFGAMMDVELVNDGPVTLLLER